MTQTKVIKVLDATTSGSESVFKSVDNILQYRLLITGTALANIKAFYVQQSPSSQAFPIKIKCDNWNGASVQLQAKTVDSDDDWSSTGDDPFTEDSLAMFFYK